MSLHKHSTNIFEARNKNFAKHNEAHENLPHAYKKNVYMISDLHNNKVFKHNLIKGYFYTLVKKIRIYKKYCNFKTKMM